MCKDVAGGLVEGWILLVFAAHVALAGDCSGAGAGVAEGKDSAAAADEAPGTDGC